MTDLEDEPDGTAMEILCTRYGQNLYRAMLSSEVETPSEFWDSARTEAARQHNNIKAARISIDDFAADSYIFHRRHKEEEMSEAVRNTLKESFGYMMAIANGLPLYTRPLRDSWFVDKRR